MTRSCTFINQHIRSPKVTRIFLGLAAACLTTLGAPAVAAEAAWKPEQPIRLVVPFPPGGGADVAARIVAQSVGDKLGKPLVVENKAGAGGSIGSRYVYTAAPDGYTLLVATADTHSIYPHVHASTNFNSQAFVPVAPITTISYVLAGRPDIDANSAKALVDQGKTKQLSYATWGAGSAAHAATGLFEKVTGLNDLLHVPYSGGGPASQALMGSQVDFLFVPVNIASSSKDRIKLLGVASDKRSDALPNVPTLAEQGYPVNAVFWIGVLAPPGTPTHIAETISKAIGETVEDPKVQEKLHGLGMVPHLGTQKEFAQYVANEYERWGKVIKDAGIRVD